MDVTSPVIPTRLQRLAAIAILASVTTASAYALPEPLAIEQIDAQLWDDPQHALIGAQAALRSDSPEHDARRLLNAALELAVTGEELERSDVARQAVERGIALAHRLQDNGALCLLHGTDA